MAQVLPAKRPRGLTSHHRAPVNGVAGPSRNKRQRYSTVDTSERNSSGDEESRHPEDDGASSNGAGQEDDTAQVDRVTQIVEKRFEISRDQPNIPAEAGIIEEIRCTNFMCHEQLTVPLGPLINFIIGRNGSGKSAVLTAITLCLGGKAAATNRGHNLKSFIKEGRDFAILSVRIKNQGPTAYAPEQYGDAIIVERHFSKSGTSSFKLKDRNGKIVSTRKTELEDIIDAFALQIDNPLSVLTQDNARQFLNDSGPGEKYKFFLKGTQLDTLDRDYKQIEQELDEQESKARHLHDDLEAHYQNLERARAKAKNASNLEKTIAEEKRVEHQAIWAQVEEDERTLDEIDAELGRISDKIVTKKVEADAQSDQFSRADQACQDAEVAVQECKAEKQPAGDDVDDCKARLEEAKKEIFNLKSTERQLVGALNNSKKSFQDTQTQIQDHEERLAQADNGVHARKIQEFEDARVVYEERKASWENHDQSVPALNERLTAARRQKRELDERLQQKRAEELQSKQKIKRLEQGGQQWQDSYRNPAALRRLIQAIETETRFHNRPVGPMGRYVELTKPEWGSILEKSFGRALDAFVVTSKADQVILANLQRQYNYPTPILIGTTENPIDTSGHEPAEDLLTWMRALKITNPLVRNQLIINHSIEQVVLIQKRSEAQNFMNQNGPRRANVKMCFCMADTTRKAGHVITVNQRTGASSLGPIDEYRNPFRMQADKGPQIQEEKDNLTNIQRQIGDLEAQGRVAQNELNASQAKIQDHKRQLRDLKVQMDQAQEDRDRLEDEVNTSTTDAAVIEQLKKELVDAQGEVDLNEQQYEDLTLQLDKATEEMRSRQAQLSEANKLIEEVSHRLDKKISKFQTVSRRREQALREKNRALKEVDDEENRKSEVAAKREEQQTKLQKRVEDSEMVCARVEVPAGATFDSLKRKKQRLETARVKAEAELGGSVDDLVRKALDAKKIYEEARKERRATENVRRILKRALKNRWERLEKFRAAISLRAQISFQYFLVERQFQGVLKIDHTNKRLDIFIQPADATNALRQTKALSGGEKSFSTICLLLSLWDAMGSPIRCLDEFDVFMDVANRQVAMHMMVAAARRAVGRQYILITPQDISSQHIGNSEDVKIIRMADPERGQTTINFG